MKNLMLRKTLLFVAVLFAGLLSFSSCKKDAGTGTFALHLHTYLDNNEVEDYNTIYITDSGRKISLELAQLYLSHIQLVKTDGTVFDVSGKKVLKVLEEDVYDLGDVPAGDYKSIRFHLGFDATDNKAAASSDAAVLDHPEMWFGAAPQPDGYVFLHVKGTIDPTADASGTVAQMQPFEYKFGTSANYIEVSLPEKTFTVVKGEEALEHLLFDYSAIFNGIDLTQSANLSVLTAAANATTPGTLFTSKLAAGFRYED